MSETYDPVMSTHHIPAPRAPTAAARSDDHDGRRSGAFWAAFRAAPAGPSRWMDSAAAAWRPADTAEPGSAVR